MQFPKNSEPNTYCSACFNGSLTEWNINTKNALFHLHRSQSDRHFLHDIKSSICYFRKPWIWHVFRTLLHTYKINVIFFEKQSKTTVASFYRFWRFRSAGRSPPPGGRSPIRTWCGARALTIWLAQGRCCCSASRGGRPTPSSHRGSPHSHTCRGHANVIKYLLTCIYRD